MTVTTMFLPVVFLCVISLGFSLLGFIWGCMSRHFWPAIMLCAVAALMSYGGLQFLHVNASQTVNGKLQWHLESKWFFWTSLPINLLALAFVAWRGRRIFKAG